MGIDAVVWDIDDTIFDYTAADRAGMRGHLAAEGLLDGHTSVEQALARWREITDAQWARFSAGETDWQGQRRERVRVFVGERLSDADADAWFDRYVRHYETAWTLFPDVLPVLDRLTGSHRHAVLSNSSLLVQDRKLRVLGVHRTAHRGPAPADRVRSWGAGGVQLSSPAHRRRSTVPQRCA
ncbi:HAD family hydrolase [Streptomyces sp. NPDC005534]|uniref:HAD family hydrolase n=1 Tax=Streptomyces sp. NPDC005534 TaxID=3155714 RepID=UPI003453FB54